MEVETRRSRTNDGTRQIRPLDKYVQRLIRSFAVVLILATNWPPMG